MNYHHAPDAHQDAARCAICGDPALHQERGRDGRYVGACRFHKASLQPLQLASRARAAALVDDRVGRGHGIRLASKAMAR